MTFLSIYLIVGCAVATWIWFKAGRYAPEHPECPKWVILALIVTWWPIAVLVLLWERGGDDDA